MATIYGCPERESRTAKSTVPHSVLEQTDLACERRFLPKTSSSIWILNGLIMFTQLLLEAILKMPNVIILLSSLL